MARTAQASTISLLARESGFDPIEDRLRENTRTMIEAVFRERLGQFPGRLRYSREGGDVKG